MNTKPLISILILFCLILSGCSGTLTIDRDEPETTIPAVSAEPAAATQTFGATETAPALTEPTSTPFLNAIETVPPSATSNIPVDYTIDIDEIIASGFNRPLGVMTAGDGSERLFVVEKGGRIWIIQNGSLLSEPFLDLSDRVSGGSEQGLLGLAFHPEYENNGLFYVDYTDLQGSTQIVEYRVSDQPDQADPSTASTLMSFGQPYANHNGGHIAFGPDGYLYIALGDGGSANDPQNNGQDLATPLGSLLRIEVTGDGGFTVPQSNPFVADSDADERIWAWGLRNPWRFSFDLETGDLYIGDVGQNQWEEIDYQMAGSAGGLNYGWRCLEGSHEYINQPPCSDPNYTDQFIAPIAEYSHQIGQSITGGYVYRGSQYPFLSGIYFYADFVSGRIWSIRLLDRQSQAWSEPRLELESGLSISSFGQDEKGEIYIADFFGGTIRLLAAVPQ